MAIEFYKLIVGALPVLIALYTKKFEEIDRNQAFPDNPRDFLLPQSKEYDFIIVGAGSAGATVANQLSKKFRVLLLETGGDPIPPIYVPSQFGYLNTEPAIMHLWDSVKQKNSNLDNDGNCRIGTGKFIGGSSVINGMVYNRGSPKDYDNWANLTDDDSWAYKNVLKYFKMAEDFYEDENLNDHLGVGGPLAIGNGKIHPELKQVSDAFIAAGVELGFPQVENTNSPQIEGFGPIAKTIQFGRRVSVYEAYIKPILDRTSLTISRYSTVSEVDIDENKRAIGVHYTRHGVPMYAKARREVILSAGTMNSPHIMMKSGIGPANQLKAAGISVKADLPVGENFQDHPHSVLCARYDKSLNTYPFLNATQEDVDKYLENGQGPLAISGGTIAQGFIVSSVSKLEGDLDWPDLDLTAFHNTPLYIPDGDNSICIVALLGRVASRGSLKLDPTDVNKPLIWDPQYLAEERDLKVLAEGARLAAAFIKTQVFKNFGLSLDASMVTSPGCKQLQFDTNEYWECHVRHYTRTTWHPTSTCKMGKTSDKNAVVDTKLRVRGISGLRVIDNSIQPTVTNANTNAPAIMIGHKGAHMILAEDP